MASYREIKNYVLEKHGRRVKSGWIAHAKEVYGIPVKRQEIGREKKDYGLVRKKICR